MSRIQYKIINMTHTQEKRKSTEITPKMIQILELAHRDFKACIITMIKDIKKNMLKENEKIGTNITEIQTIKKNQTEIFNSIVQYNFL